MTFLTFKTLPLILSTKQDIISNNQDYDITMMSFKETVMMSFKETVMTSQGTFNLRWSCGEKLTVMTNFLPSQETCPASSLCAFRT